MLVLTFSLLLRMLNRSTGLPTKLLDSLSITAPGAILVSHRDWFIGWFPLWVCLVHGQPASWTFEMQPFFLWLHDSVFHHHFVGI